MKKTNLLAISLTALMLSACSYKGNLEKKLAGTDQATKQDILAAECHKEAAPPNTNSPQNIKSMAELCNAMIDEMKQQGLKSK